MVAVNSKFIIFEYLGFLNFYLKFYLNKLVLYKPFLVLLYYHLILLLFIVIYNFFNSYYHYI
nr:MAG TPA: hypothetical protein [Bacteriophage sp.]